MTPAGTAVQAPPTPLIDPRIAKLGGTRRDRKATYDFPGMQDQASWRRTLVHEHTYWYGCSLCGVKLAGPSAVYVHLAKRHPERFDREVAATG
jgi:hypothetical protein